MLGGEVEQSGTEVTIDNKNIDSQGVYEIVSKDESPQSLVLGSLF